MPQQGYKCDYEFSNQHISFQKEGSRCKVHVCPADVLVLVLVLVRSGVQQSNILVFRMRGARGQLGVGSGTRSLKKFQIGNNIM